MTAPRRGRGEKGKQAKRWKEELWVWVRYEKGVPHYVCKGWPIGDTKADLLARHPSHPSRYVRPTKVLVRITPIRKPRKGKRA